jgi:hypothetical protein
MSRADASCANALPAIEPAPIPINPHITTDAKFARTFIIVVLIIRVSIVRIATPSFCFVGARYIGALSSPNNRTAQKSRLATKSSRAPHYVFSEPPLRASVRSVTLCVFHFFDNTMNPFQNHPAFVRESSDGWTVRSPLWRNGFRRPYNIGAVFFRPGRSLKSIAAQP